MFLSDGRWRHSSKQVHVYVCVVESEFYTKLKKLDVQGGKKDKLFADLVTQVCKAHNWVIVSFPESSRCKQVRGQPQRGRGRT